MSTKEIKTQLVVLGSGPGGYTCAFRAADLGQQVVLVEAFDNLGGVCLNVGCIPSKGLLHIAKVIKEAEESNEMGVSFAKPKVDIKKLRNWVETKVIGKLTMGLKGLSKQRKVTTVTGIGKFLSSNIIEVTDKKNNKTIINFENAVIACGSKPIKLPFIPESDNVMDSTDALLLKDIPKKMLVIGGGIIGMELGTVYEALGSKVSVVELAGNIIPGVDKDLVAPLQKRMSKLFEKIMLNTKVTAVNEKKSGLEVTFEDKSGNITVETYDKILLSVGRVPRGKEIDAVKAGVIVDDRGFIPVDNQMRTNVKNIFAIGDVAGNPMLAHKAIPEGKVAAEVIAGQKHYFQPKCIPSVAYTDPEIAWVGVTESEAKEKNIDYDKGVFPWAASGRALANGRDDGLTKVIFDKKSNTIIGAGITGTNAGDLISEAGLAIEMGCDSEDISLTIHPHPTLAETLAAATEMYTGEITDLYVKK